MTKKHIRSAGRDFDLNLGETILYKGIVTKANTAPIKTDKRSGLIIKKEKTAKTKNNPNGKYS